MRIGTRNIKGWIHFYWYLTKLRLHGIYHGLLPTKHFWEFREAPDCGCCGGNEMRCYSCGTYVSVDEVIAMAKKSVAS